MKTLWEEMRAVSWTIWVAVAVVSVVVSSCGTPGKDEMASSTDKGGQAGEHPRYEKPAGVQCHIPAILGMAYRSFQGSDIEAHLGPVVGKKRLPGVRGQAIQYEKGELLVARGRIYGVSYTFERPVSLLEALHDTGLPESLGSEFVPTSRELRIERSPYGFRRLVLVRSAPGEERFVAIRAWKILPQEKY